MKRGYSYAEAIEYLGVKRPFFDEHIRGKVCCGLLRNARAIANLTARSKPCRDMGFEERTMKATITEDGELVIQAESSLERYALQRWQDDYRAGKATVRVDMPAPRKKPLSINSPRRPAHERAASKSFEELSGEILARRKKEKGKPES